MRGAKAKRIRKAVYGDESLRNQRKYMEVPGHKGPQRIAIGKRRQYQDEKRRQK